MAELVRSADARPTRRLTSLMLSPSMLYDLAVGQPRRGFQCYCSADLGPSGGPGRECPGRSRRARPTAAAAAGLRAVRAPAVPVRTGGSPSFLGGAWCLQVTAL